MSTQRSKSSKLTSHRRLSLRKKSISKSSKSPRRNPPSLGLQHVVNPKPFSLNMPRSKSTNVMSSIDNMNNLFKTSPKITQINSRTCPNPQQHAFTHHQNTSSVLSHPSIATIDFSLASNGNNDQNENESSSESPSPSFPPVNSSSIPSFDREDSDDEAKAQKYIRLLHPNRQNSAIRRIQSTPAMSSMVINDNDNEQMRDCQQLFSQNSTSASKRPSYVNTQITNKNVYKSDTSPSTESDFRFSQNAIVKSEDGLLSYYGQDRQCTNFQEKTFKKSHSNRIMSSAVPRLKDRIHHNSLSSLRSNKDKKRRKKKEKRNLSIGCLEKRNYKNENAEKRNDYSQSSHQQQQQQSERGLVCSLRTEMGWDCLTVSNDSKLVALFSRNSMALLKINEYGQFELLRDLRTGKKKKIIHGAVDAQFYPLNATKCASCTRDGKLMVLDFNMKGRGWLNGTTHCPLQQRGIQRIHKVCWIKNSEAVLAAHDDGNVYYWDTRIDARSSSANKAMSKSFQNGSSALSVKMSPFNDYLFASSHKNGIVNIWDIRNEKSPFLSITADKYAINCIDWHPAIPNVIASCGYRDITIKVWSLSEDEVAQQRYSEYWRTIKQDRSYNNEDDYRVCSVPYAPTQVSIQQQQPQQMTMNRPQSVLQPRCTMFPSGNVSQIGWRPCTDARSLSAMQIACSYIGSQQVEMWDIKSSFVPVASFPTNKSETKFEFISRSRPYLSQNDDENVKKGEQTYLISCSKDKSVKLTDCKFSDIPRSHLSTCALDIAPFGDACFVSIARPKLHPFDAETYRFENKVECKTPKRSISMKKSSSLGELRSDFEDDFLLNIPSHSSPNRLKKPRSYSGNVDIFNDDNVPFVDTKTLQCPSPNTSKSSPSSTRSVSTIFSGFFAGKKTSPQRPSNKTVHTQKRVNMSAINAMAGGFGQNELKLLSDDMFNNSLDAFSEYESNLTVDAFFKILEQTLSPCDSSLIFSYFAKNYVLSGDNISNICRQNALIALNVGNNELNQLWNLLAVLLKNVLQQNEDFKKKMSKSTKDGNIVCIDHKAMDEKFEKLDDENDEEEDDVDEDDDDFWWDDEVSSHSFWSANSDKNHQSFDDDYMHTPPLKCLENAFFSSSNAATSNNGERRENDNDKEMILSYIEEVLEENIERGDVQTASTIICILNEYICLHLDEEYVADIVLAYLDLLLHRKLLIEAVNVWQITKTNNSLIDIYFLTQTRLIVKCVRCKDIMRNHQCFKCHKESKCSQCHQKLMDKSNNDKLKLQHPNLLIWCQICGHGGHYDHMIQWFINQKPCSIESCSHQCVPILIRTDCKNHIL